MCVQVREIVSLDKNTTLKLPRGFHRQSVRIPGLEAIFSILFPLLSILPLEASYLYAIRVMLHENFQIIIIIIVIIIN